MSWRPGVGIQLYLPRPLFAHREIGWRRDGSSPATVTTYLRPPRQWELNPTPVFHWLQPKNVGLQSQCLQIVHRSGVNGPGRRPASMQRVHEYTQSDACISLPPQAGDHTVQRKEERQDAGPGLWSAGMKPPGLPGAGTSCCRGQVWLRRGCPGHHSSGCCSRLPSSVTLLATVLFYSR